MGQRILWLDNRADDLGAYLEALCLVGYAVDVAKTVYEALSLIADETRVHDLLLWEIFGQPLRTDDGALAGHWAVDRSETLFVAELAYEAFRKRYPRAPTYLFTTQCRLCPYWAKPEHNDHAICKSWVFPSELALRVQTLLASCP